MGDHQDPRSVAHVNVNLPAKHNMEFSGYVTESG